MHPNICNIMFYASQVYVHQKGMLTWSSGCRRGAWTGGSGDHWSRRCDGGERRVMEQAHWAPALGLGCARVEMMGGGRHGR